jgi:4-hydroxy-tetrahydrodipicolinate reductase
MTSLLIVGSEGKMGKTLIEMISQNSNLKFQGVDVVSGSRKIEEILPQSVDVVIDFSSPKNFSQVCLWCKTNNKPLISGTTGVTEENKKSLKELSQTQACLWSANMSLGVNVLNELIKKLNLLGPDFDFQIEEFHHKHKKDQPSGTALFLQETLLSCVKTPIPSPLSIRAGGVFGVHKIHGISEEEWITLEHKALNRGVFARGALRAASWIVGKKPGLYNFSDVLGLN